MEFAAILEYFEDPKIAEIYYLDVRRISLRDKPGTERSQRLLKKSTEKE